MRRECAEISSRVYDRRRRLVEGGRFATEKPGPPFGRWSDWAGFKAAAAVRTYVEEHILYAISAECTLVRADSRDRGCWRQISVTIFAVWP